MVILAAETIFTPTLAVIAGIAAVLLVAVAEWLHQRRMARIARLAFAGSPTPARWVAAVPVLRVLAAGAATWGLVYLAGFDAGEPPKQPTRAASQHLLVCLDVSPSMLIKDSGPDPEKVSRAVWAGKVVHGVLDRLDAATTRVTLVAFYTEGRPIVRETFDKEVIRNALDGLPMYQGFEPGPTSLNDGIVESFEIAKPWPANSATLLVVSDGDATPTPPPPIPASISDVIVVGVGDPGRPTLIAGHSSRQDGASLKLLATRLGGRYHDGNTRHIPSAVLAGLSMTTPQAAGALSLRDLALWATGLGCGILAALGPALMLFGVPRPAARTEGARGERPATATSSPLARVAEATSGARRTLDHLFRRSSSRGTTVTRRP